MLALAGAQGSGASVLAGFFQFDGDKSFGPPNPRTDYADEVMSGIAGWIESPAMASGGGGGSMDGHYGNSGIAVGTAPSWGDGYGAIKVYPNVNQDTTATGSSVLKFSMTNNTGYSINLAGLYFDAAASTGQIDRFVQIDFITLLGTTPLGAYGPLDPTAPQDFGDYSVSLGNYLMANSETVSLVFTAPAGSPVGTVTWIDNVAVSDSFSPPVGVPDSGNALALLGVAFAGLTGLQRLTRSRRA